MFKRRKQQPVHHRVGNLFWPRIGWGRAFRYLWHRVLRLHGTPYSIAAGIACGVAISFTPLAGAHFLLSALFAWLIGGNIVASLIGTAAGNPWTFPFIWLWTYELGTAFGAGRDLAPGAVNPNFAQLFGDLLVAMLRFDIGAPFLHKVWVVWWPMMVGSIPSAILAWLATYLVLRPLVAAYQHRRILRRRKKRHARLEAQRAEKRAVEAVAVMAGLKKEFHR